MYLLREASFKMSDTVRNVVRYVIRKLSSHKSKNINFAWKFFMNETNYLCTGISYEIRLSCDLFLSAFFPNILTTINIYYKLKLITPSILNLIISLHHLHSNLCLKGFFFISLFFIIKRWRLSNFGFSFKLSIYLGSNGGISEGEKFWISFLSNGVRLK